MRGLLIIALLCISSFGFAQNYSYSFSGEIGNSDSYKKLNDELKALPGVKTIELKYKNDSKKGEFVIFVEETSTGDNPTEFSAADLKAILIRNGLSPIQFRELKK